ncbi:hypothetical protein ACQ4PT_049319 [Festuca glaucescens]
MVINMSRARGAACSRFLAVGVFLSVLAISSKSLIDSMKRVWKIRGHLESHQLDDRRFVLDFAEEGDFNHVIKGGPWKYREDPIIVNALHEGEEPETVQFTTIPIWVQFRKIPFYLLTRALAKRLGLRIGMFICIDKNARGDICDKFVRARVHLPLDQALQRWILLIDEFTNDEVVAHVHYERLPTFCFLCGFIGHKDTSCAMAGGSRRRMYNAELAMDPIHTDDPRCWFLPETIGQAQLAQPYLGRDHLRPSIMVAPGWDIVAHVARKVERLYVNDKRTTNALLIKIDDNNEPDTDSSSYHTHESPPPVIADTVGREDDTAAVLPATTPPMLNYAETNTTSFQVAVVLPAEIGVGTEKGATKPSPEQGRWKRRPKQIKMDKVKIQEGDTRTTHGSILGAAHQREEEEDNGAIHATKRTLYQVPSLEECLAKEGLQVLREQEGETGFSNVNVLPGVNGETISHVVGEVCEVVGENSVGHTGGDVGNISIQPASGDQLREKEKEQQHCKKTDPDTGGTEPGTKEGAWTKK